jgi:hypothetical protein
MYYGCGSRQWTEFIFVNKFKDGYMLNFLVCPLQCVVEEGCQLPVDVLESRI